ncbi:MAG: porin family protein [Magnetococcales bacterium]|nr:porin family protein [Magnetococcales bacterium]
MKEMPVLVVMGLLGMGGTATAAPYNGFYVGPELGVDHDLVKSHYEDPSNSYDQDGSGSDGINCGVFGGYQVKTGNGVFSFEANYEGSSSRYHDSAGFSIRDKWSYGLSGRVGYLIRNALLYGRLGWVRTRFAVADNPVFSVGNDLDGVRLGAGIETGLTNTLSLRGEYLFTHYEDWVVKQALASYRFSPDKGQFKVGLAYHY